MNYRGVLYLLGRLLIALAVALVAPAAVLPPPLPTPPSTVPVPAKCSNTFAPSKHYREGANIEQLCETICEKVDLRGYGFDHFIRMFFKPYG